MIVDLEGARRRRSTDTNAIEAAFMLAVYRAARERRLRLLGRLPVPPLSDEGASLLARTR